MLSFFSDTIEFSKEGTAFKMPKMENHSKERTCNICTKSFDDLKTLKIYERTHSDCLKLYSSKSNPNIHESTHSKENPSQCKICSKTFFGLADLEKHERIH